MKDKGHIFLTLLMAASPQSTFNKSLYFGLHKELQLSFECKVCFIFMTCDRIPVKIGTRNGNPKNPNIEQGTLCISRSSLGTIWCCCHRWALFDDFVSMFERGKRNFCFILGTTSAQCRGENLALYGATQILVKEPAPTANSPWRTVWKPTLSYLRNQILLQTQLRVEFVTLQQGWVSDMTLGVHLGLGRSFQLHFSSLFLPRPGWEGSLGWASHSFNPGKGIHTNASLGSPKNRNIFLL